MPFIRTIFCLFILSACSAVKNKAQTPIDKKTIGLLPTEIEPEISEVARFQGTQVTGITSAKGNRLFASFPRLRKNIPFSVVEILSDGRFRPYPDISWNNWKNLHSKKAFISIESLAASGHYLYVLDSSSPEMKGPVAPPAIYRFDLRRNQFDRSWYFDQSTVGPKSYFNDLTVDRKSKKIFISDSGEGAIIVLDLKTGQSKKVLGEHPSTKSESVVLTIDEKEFRENIHSEGITLSPIDHKLYYHALTAYHLYRVPVNALSENLTNEKMLHKKVEKLGITPAPDGMIFDKRGNLFMGDLERNAISYRTPSGEMKILVQDERIKWPDSFTIDENENLIFTDSDFQSTKIGDPVDNKIFKVYKVRLPNEY